MLWVARLLSVTGEQTLGLEGERCGLGGSGARSQVQCEPSCKEFQVFFMGVR